MKLLFCIKGLVVAGGGAERVFVEVANAMHELGHQVAVMTFDQPGQQSYYALDPDIALFELAAGASGKPTPRASLPGLILRIRRTAQDFAPDVAVAFMHSAYVPLSAALTGTGIKTIISEHTEARHFRDKPLQRVASALAFRQAVVKTVPSEPVRQQHSQRELARVVTMPNPVASTEGQEIPAATDREPIILSVGRLRTEKDFPTLISAFAQLAPDYPEYRLRIVGDGAVREQLEAMVAKSPAHDRIEMPGALSDVAIEYRRASLFALPSLYESFGIVVGEAMANGCPVVAFADNLGAASLIDDGQTGMLVPPGTDRAAALAAGIRSLLDEADMRDAYAAAARPTIEKYSPTAVIERWEGLFKAVVDNAPIANFEGSKR